MTTTEVKKAILEEGRDKFPDGDFGMLGRNRTLMAFLSTALDRMEKAAREEVIEDMKNLPEYNDLLGVLIVHCEVSKISNLMAKLKSQQGGGK